jgi:hypothetical protein
MCVLGYIWWWKVPRGIEGGIVMWNLVDVDLKMSS